MRLHKITRRDQFCKIFQGMSLNGTITKTRSLTQSDNLSNGELLSRIFDRKNQYLDAPDCKQVRERCVCI